MEVVSKIIIIVAVILAMALLFALPVMWLWNDLMPDLFGLKTIGFWAALKINILTGILFRSTSSNSK